MLKLFIMLFISFGILHGEILDQLNGEFFEKVTLTRDSIYVNFYNNGLKSRIIIGEFNDFNLRYNDYGERLVISNDTTLELGYRDSRFIISNYEKYKKHIIEKLMLDSLPTSPALYLFSRVKIKYDVIIHEELYYPYLNDILLEFFNKNKIQYQISDSTITISLPKREK